jgi:GAF domain-containing protein
LRFRRTVDDARTVVRASEEPYSREDKQLLASVAGQAGVALESIRLAEKIAE